MMYNFVIFATWVDEYDFTVIDKWCWQLMWLLSSWLHFMHLLKISLSFSWLRMPCRPVICCPHPVLIMPCFSLFFNLFWKQYFLIVACTQEDSYFCSQQWHNCSSFLGYGFSAELISFFFFVTNILELHN